MKTYYIQLEHDRQGPFSADQLIEMKIQPATKIWVASLKTVLDASDIPELRRRLFPLSTAYVASRPIRTTVTEEVILPKKQTSLKEKVQKGLALLALVIAAFLVVKLRQGESSNPVAAAASSTPALVTPGETKKSKAKETINPAALIKANVSWRKNLIGEAVLTGTLKNNSATAAFKDPVVSITWLNKANEIIGTERLTISETLKSGQTVSFKLKLKAPGKIGDVRMSVESATRSS